LSTIQAEFQGTSYFTSSIGGAVRWTAPELYHVPEDSSENEEDLEAPADKLSEQSDIYSFGCVMLQVSKPLPTPMAADFRFDKTLSGRVPYHTIRRDTQVIEWNRKIATQKVC
jgi:serine/threonine protein kinase